MAEKPTIIIYGNDQGARNVASNLQKSAADNFNVVRYSADMNEPVADEEIARNSGADAALFGLSGRRPEADVVRRLKAAGFKGKIGFFEDYPRTATTEGTPAMHKAAEGATAFVIQPGDEEAARNFGYADVKVTGFPDHWMGIVDDMNSGRALRSKPGRVRIERMGTHEIAELTPNDSVAFVSGMIDPVTEQNVIETLFDHFGDRLRILFRPHPSERNNAELADAILRRDKALQGKSWRVLNKEVADAGSRANNYLIGISDAAILHPGSTAGILFAN